jgi:RND family efflux transporter MFP subunit
VKLIVCVILTALCAVAIAIPGVAGPYRIGLQTTPDVVPVGRAKLQIKLTDSKGSPVVGAVVKVLAQMPGMPMGEREEIATPGPVEGTYSAPAVFGMAGSFDVRISITGSLGAGETTIKLATGESSGSGRPGGIPIGAAAILAVVVLGIGLIMRQVRKTGQEPNWRSVFSLQAALSLLLLGGALAVAMWAINTFRRPGSMTPLEAQSMEMSTPAPEGTLPVSLAKVELKPFGTTVTYTGQAQGFVEQDVVARVAGGIVWMPFYVGDKVVKGQVVARLDTTQTAPMFDEKSAQSMAAAQGVDIAQSDYKKALAEVTQAEAEQAIREGAIDEAKAMVTASRQEQLSSEANLRAQQAAVADVHSQVVSAEADRDYWVQELERTKQLYAKGAVSKDELQKAQASTTSAIAKVRQAQAGVEEANARVQSATASVTKANAEVAAAQNRQIEMQAEHHAHMAHVGSARAGAESAKKRISQAGSESRMARASLEGVRSQLGYAELRAEVDGVVTSRLISPGVVISPGQSVLKIAQISPIRLQANVPESDLARIQLGATVRIKRRDVSEAPLELKVTSVSPSVDPASRMGVVEAIYANADGRFKPGQYIAMEISIGGQGRSLVVPSDAVETEEGGVFAWVAEPATNNQFSVSRHEIKIGGRSGGSVAVTSGLQPGQLVVVAPPQGLAAGTMVTSVVSYTASTAEPAKANQTIEITAAGYSPPSISIPSGKPLKLTFIRRDDKTCGTEVIFPDLGIRKALPLNQPVTIDIPAQPAGKELNFTCPMNMLNGKAVAR